MLTRLMLKPLVIASPPARPAAHSQGPRRAQQGGKIQRALQPLGRQQRHQHALEEKAGHGQARLRRVGSFP